MPILDISPDGLATLPEVARNYVAAVMLWPDDEAARARGIHAGQVDAIRREAERRPGESLPADLLPWMLDAPRIGDMDIRMRYRSGAAVGEVLGEIVADLQKGLKIRPRTLTAIKEEVAQRLGLKRHGSTISMSTIEKIWSDFRPVAALWAAHRMFHVGGAVVPCRATAVPEFLAQAEWLRRSAESLRPKGSKGMLIAAGVAWTVPASIQLPAGSMRFAPKS